MKSLLVKLTVIISIVFIPFAILYASKHTYPPYLIGTGIYDITGPSAEIGMMGYGREEQKDTGILTRLYARAFIIVDQKTSKRVVFVSSDLAMLFHSIVD